MMNKLTSTIWKSRVKTIMVSGFTAGTLDIVAVVAIYCFILEKTTPVRLMQFIASGLFGKRAFTGGTEMALYGLGLHFLIAFIFATTYFLLFPHIPFFRKHRIWGGLVYGIFIWIMMNMFILPLVFGQFATMTFKDVLIGILILMVMVGLPVSFITHKHYILKNRQTFR